MCALDPGRTWPRPSGSHRPTSAAFFGSPCYRRKIVDAILDGRQPAEHLQLERPASRISAGLGRTALPLRLTAPQRPLRRAGREPRPVPRMLNSNAPKVLTIIRKRTGANKQNLPDAPLYFSCKSRQGGRYAPRFITRGKGAGRQAPNEALLEDGRAGVGPLAIRRRRKFPAPLPRKSVGQDRRRFRDGLRSFVRSSYKLIGTQRFILITCKFPP